MLLLNKILIFFGLKKAPVAPQIVSPLDTLKSNLQKSPKQNQVAILEAAKTTSVQVLDSLDSFIAEPPADSKEYLSKLTDNFDILVYIYQHQQTENGNFAWKKDFDQSYEELLELLPKKLVPLGAVKEKILADIDAYIQKYEEDIYLKEAQADYEIQISENRKWIKWPFLVGKVLKSGRRIAAKKVCADMFFDCPSLETLEFQARVPWNSVSFLEIRDLPFSKAVNLSVEKNNYYYTYLY
jgi:hypothetical protein